MIVTTTILSSSSWWFLPLYFYYFKMLHLWKELFQTLESGAQYVPSNSRICSKQAMNWGNGLEGCAGGSGNPWLTPSPREHLGPSDVCGDGQDGGFIPLWTDVCWLAGGGQIPWGWRWGGGNRRLAGEESKCVGEAGGWEERQKASGAPNSQLIARENVGDANQLLE